MDGEIDLLPADALLVASGELAVLIGMLGRSRWCSRRSAGCGRLRSGSWRGNGKPKDHDQFDETYLHLFVWNHARQEVVGAYRIAATDQVRSLYTATLFHFKPDSSIVSVLRSSSAARLSAPRSASIRPAAPVVERNWKSRREESSLQDALWAGQH